MNRPIKFRAWDKEDKKMDYAPSLPTYEAGRMWLNGWFAENKYFELMQFTGLLDKNGKEIYEGDIVKTKYAGVLKVEWGKGWQGEPADYMGPFFGWTLVGAKDPYDEAMPLLGNEDDHNQPEVIGNIYENPDLLSV